MFEAEARLSGAVHIMRDITERKRMVDRLKQSEALLADAQQLAHVGSFQIDTDTGSLLWSSEMHRIFDIPAHAHPLDFEEISALTHPTDRERLRTTIKKLLLEAGPVSTDFRVLLPNGRKKHLRLLGQELRDEQGRLFGMSGAVLDMTAEMLSAAEQKNDEERLALLLQMTGMQHASERELCEWALESVVKITGSTGGYFHLFDEKEQSITLTVWSSAVKQECMASSGQHYPLGKAGIWADSIRRRAVVVHNNYADEQNKSGLPEGHFPLTRHLGVPVFDGESIVAAAGVANKEEPYTASDVRQIQFFMNDMWKIIARSRAEKKLAESEAAYRGLFETSQDGIFRIGMDGRVERANAAFAGIFGYASPDELVGRSISDFTDSPLDWQVYQAVMQQKGQIQRYPFQMRSATGAHRDVEVTANMIRNSSGDFVALEGIVRDVTESRQLAEQLRHAQKMEAIGRLAGGIAHDFNNILSAIIGFASLPLMSGTIGELERTTLQQIIELTERASSLTRGLMAFSRRQVMTMKAIDMNQVVRVSTKLLHRLIGEDIILKVHETSEPLPVMADVGQLEQVLMNLATNARDAMPGGGNLTIETRRVSVSNLEHEGILPGFYALTTVTDTGTGIPAEHLDKIFEPFFTTKESGKGTGLGLSSVYGIMQQHAGSVRVVSTPGSGTSFLLYLPLSERAGESLAENATTPVSGGTETLLIVEDDTPLRTIMRRVLAMHGYTVLEAETGAAAVGICAEREGHIDLVLSDAVMPEMGGFEAWQIIHGRFPSIRFVFMSGYISDEDKRTAISRLGLPYITKPFEPRQLLEIVRKELDRV